MILVIAEGAYEMEWLTDEIMFYGGVAVAGGSALAAIIFFCIFKVKKIKLNAQLDREYGKRSQ